MLEHMKMLPIKNFSGMAYQGSDVWMPMQLVQNAVIKFEDSPFREERTYSVEEVFSDLIKKYSRAGALLGGLRYREGLTQREFAKILNVTQSNLSAMENGKRSIGKELAKRIATKFKLDYRMFL